MLLLLSANSKLHRKKPSTCLAVEQGVGSSLDSPSKGLIEVVFKSLIWNNRLFIWVIWIKILFTILWLIQIRSFPEYILRLQNYITSPKTSIVKKIIDQRRKIITTWCTQHVCTCIDFAFYRDIISNLAFEIFGT